MEQKKTSELLEIMKKSRNYDSFENDGDFIDVTPKNAIWEEIDKKGLSRAEVIEKSHIEQHYAYQILQGKKTPSRDKVIMLGIGAELTFDEIQVLLKKSGLAPLYVKDKRDSIIAYGIMNNKSVMDIDSLLYEKEFNTLT